MLEGSTLWEKASVDEADRFPDLHLLEMYAYMFFHCLQWRALQIACKQEKTERHANESQN